RVPLRFQFGNFSQLDGIFAVECPVEGIDACPLLVEVGNPQLVADFLIEDLNFQRTGNDDTDEDRQQDTRRSLQELFETRCIFIDALYDVSVHIEYRQPPQQSEKHRIPDGTSI